MGLMCFISKKTHSFHNPYDQPHDNNLVGGFNHVEAYYIVSWDYCSQYMEK